LLNKLQKYKLDDNFPLVIYELCESLVFDKLFSFLHLNISRFNNDEELIFKNKIQNYKNEFSFQSFGLDSLFNNCKFKGAISEFKKIATVATPFEKLVNYFNKF